MKRLATTFAVIDIIVAAFNLGLGIAQGWWGSYAAAAFCAAAACWQISQRKDFK